MPTPTNYTTQLSPEEEAAFRKWYTNYANVTGNDANPDAPEHYYDYRGYWKENPNAEVSKGMHLPDTWKTPGHETFSLESKYAKGNENLAGTWDSKTGEYVTTPGVAVAQAYKRYQDSLQQHGDENHAAVKSAYDAWQTAAAETEKARAEGAAAVRQNINDYLEAGYNATDAILQAENNRIAEETQKAEDQLKAEQNAAIWTGAGEVAASLANLIAVGGHNAVNQQYKQYSQDWMRTADQNWRANRARIDNMRDRQRAIQQHMIQMKMEGGKTLANFDMGENNARNAAAGRAADANLRSTIDLAGIKGKTADAVAQAGLQGEMGKIKADQQEQARQDANAARNAQIALQYDLHGWTRDPKTGRRVAPAGGVTVRGRGSGSGSGSSSNILVSIPPTVQGGKGTRLTINSGSLLATINANVDLLKTDDQRQVERILRGTGTQDDKAKQLERYIKSSPELLELLKQSSIAVDEFNWGSGDSDEFSQYRVGKNDDYSQYKLN